jgi:cobalamin synthase
MAEATSTASSKNADAKIVLMLVSDLSIWVNGIYHEIALGDSADGFFAAEIEGHEDLHGNSAAVMIQFINAHDLA